jgi:hypothetical protein
LLRRRNYKEGKRWIAIFMGMTEKIRNQSPPTLILPPQGGGNMRKEKDRFPFSCE